MFREMIERKCAEWYSSDSCTIKDLISYIEMKGAMRDAQIQAIKTYLFLKIGCGNRPLFDLFCSGAFNSLDLDDEELTSHTRDFFKSHPEAAAFYEFCKLSGDSKDAKKVMQVMRFEPEAIDYDRVLKESFYGIEYTDYIFSLPMGAGKTFLMAAFIYLDLYFSMIEPSNTSFSRNFIIIAPSGLKNSIIPSLKTISNFNPAWVIDDASAATIKRMVVLEPLEEDNKGDSNRIRNPNARKVSLHLQGQETQALVLITNAEKLILDKRAKNQATLETGLEDPSYNELTELIGRIPRLSVFIDEVHHASSDSIKLRKVVSYWAKKGSASTVLGFSGTPYLKNPEKIEIIGNTRLSFTEISNVVQYYPLKDGIGNFLKVPEVTVYENRENYLEIVENGLRSFFNENSTFHYPNGACSKVAVYCNDIAELEESVYPVARTIVEEFGMDPEKAILRYHESKNQYKLAADARMEFETLDQPISAIRVVLLVQIGKEGWDCRSLAGVILAKENKSTRNMVLQTCCRCLRQVTKNSEEKAWIYLCRSNATLLEAQLKEEHQMTLHQFQQGAQSPTVRLKRYNRSGVIDLPQVFFYQFEYETETVQGDGVDVKANLASIPIENYRITRAYTVKDFENRILERGLEDAERGKDIMDVASFDAWLGEIAKGGFCNISRSDLYAFSSTLRQIYDAITYEGEGVRYFSSKFDRAAINSKIRSSFYAKREVETHIDFLPESTDLLRVLNFSSTIETRDPSRYVPPQAVVEETMVLDAAGFSGRELMTKRYHYMPYHMDSGFENHVLELLNTIAESKFPDLEVYYNGDRFLSDFHIKCYEGIGPRWRYVGKYTPDFLVIKRQDDEIKKMMIVEAKGAIFSHDPIFNIKKAFVSDFFINENNKLFDYNHFEYLYIQDDMSEEEQISLIECRMKDFFEVV